MTFTHGAMLLLTSTLGSAPAFAAGAERCAAQVATASPERNASSTNETKLTKNNRPDRRKESPPATEPVAYYN